MSTWRSRSFWLGDHPYSPGERLVGDTTADVVVVGGGFTGLWSAIHAKDAEPALDVVVTEAEVVGFGASGRNGGFAMTMVGRNIHDLARKIGDERARATHLGMVDSINEIERFAADEGIDADITHPGNLTVSNGPDQDVRIHQDLDAAARLGLDDFRLVERNELRELVHTDRLRVGHLEEHCLLVDPAALARGLRDAARKRGVRVYEGTPADAIHDVDGRVEVRTPSGTITAERGVIATNAYAHAIPEIRRYIFTIYAYITLTEPLRDDQWSRIGWEGGFGIEDKRVFVHFHRPTADGRILWGGRDAPFVSSGPDPRFERDPRIFGRLEETFRWNFPQLEDVRIEHRWAGPVCGTVNVMPVVRLLGRGRVLYALGYAGHGVGPAHLIGKVVRDELLARAPAYEGLPFTTKRPVPLPPEPLRRLFLEGSQRILLRGDNRDGAPKGPLERLALKVLQ